MSLHALVISDSAVLATLLQHHFLVLGWGCDARTVSNSLIQDSESMKYDCIVTVIDTNFSSRYGDAIKEVGHFFNNLAQRLPFYLIFEHQYERGFNCWLRGTKRLYEMEQDVSRLQEAVQEIFNAESKGFDPGFMKP